ncbi:MAG: DUF1761 domain-containing protein [Patescibacteria group bacterium]
METNYLPVVISAILAMVLGAVWYGPLFGKKWIKVVGATEMDLEARKEMQKSAKPLYLIQFVLILFQVCVLSRLITGSIGTSVLSASLWIWAGFIMPTVAAASMWNNDSRQIAWTRFLIQTGYQLILFVMFGLILNWMM